MNANELKAQIVRAGLSIPKLADKIGLNKKTLYAKINGESDFKQPEIVAIQKVLGLNDEAVFAIFFAG